MTNDLALKVFIKYHKHEPGMGPWTLTQDNNEIEKYIEPLVEAWQERMRGMDDPRVDYANALDCARNLGIYDRPYVLEVRQAYNDVLHA